MKCKVHRTVLALFLVLVMTLSYFPSLAEKKEFPVLKVENGFGMIEAEDLLVDTTYWRVLKDEKASGGVYLFHLKSVTDTEDYLKEFGDDDAAQMYFDIEKEGTYTIWIRGYYNGNSGNIWHRIDNERPVRETFANCDLYTWNLLVKKNFTAGRHYLGFSPRLSNSGLDKILITSSDYYVPSGFGKEPAPFKLGKEGESLDELYYPLPSYVPPAEHPRLFIRKSELPKIIKNLTHPEHNKVWEEVQEFAAKEIDCKKTTYDESVHKYLECCAFMYLVDKEKNKEYGIKALNGLKDYINTIDTGTSSESISRSGMVLYTAKIYDWCHDLITDKEKEEIIPKLISLLTTLETGWPPVKLDAFNSDHGGENGLLIDSMALAIATYEDYPNIWNAVAGRYFAEYVAIDNFYYDTDHWHAEGDHYGASTRFANEGKSNMMISKLGFGSIISTNEHYYPYMQIYRRRPDGSLMHTGDIANLAFSGYLGSYTVPLSTYPRYKDPYLKYQLYRRLEGGVPDEYIANAFSKVDYLILNDVDVPLGSFKDLPLTWYSGTGHNMLTARTGWDEGITSNTMVVSMNGGGRARGGHGHWDNGNFEIYYKGPLAIDSGVYNGNPFIDDNGVTVTDVKAGSFHNRNYAKQTIAHNCILIYDPEEDMSKSYRYGATLNSGGQIKLAPSDSYENATSDNLIFAEPLGMDYGPDLHTPSYTYMKTDLTKSYDYRADEYTRSFVFLNFFDEVYPGALIVLDKVTSSNAEFKKTWLLHSQQEPYVSGNVTTIERTEFGYNGRLVNETLLPEADNRTIAKVGGEGKEYLVGDINVKAVPSVKGDESGKWRIEISPERAKNTDYFLNVMHVFEADDSITPLKSEYYETNKHFGVKIKDRVAFISKNTEREAKSVEIYSEGTEEKLCYMVDGLKEGRWLVKNGNEKIAECDATSQGGVIYFEAAPGKYTIVKMRGYDDIPEKDYDWFKNINYGANEIEPDLQYNSLYQHFENPIILEDDKPYMPLEEIIRIMDEYSELDCDGNKISVLFEDNNYNFEIGKQEVSKSNEFYNKKESFKLLDSLKYIDNVVYISLYDISVVFEKKVSYDSKSKISRITNNFKRAKDYIVNVGNPLRIPVVNTYDIDAYEGRNAFMALDGDLGTPAGTNIIGGEMTYEFKEIVDLSQLKIAWYSGNTRDYIYEFYVSENGVDYKKVAEGNSGLNTVDYAVYDINETDVKFFKIKGLGNTANNWFNINEIMFFKKE